MKKRGDYDIGLQTNVFKKWILAMKMLTCLLFLSFSALYATTNAQVVVSIKVENASLEEVFRQITQQTGYHFVYSSNELKGNKKINLNVREVELNELLKKALKDTKLRHLINDDIIMIIPYKESLTQLQQAITITGIVRDSEGLALPGVSVSIHGTRIGTTTDANGRFSLSVGNAENIELRFSFIGMKPRIVAYKDRPREGEWVIVMEDEMTEVDEVIITGYQRIKKHELTGSVASIKAAEIMQDGKFSISQMLEGEIAGMMVTVNSGEPSATPKIRIRGTSSIVGSKAPLWVLDGVILDDPVSIDYSDLNGDDAAYLIGNAIAGINPYDIESISVLKDAAAASVYGVQAANGVIVVNTKRGHVGKPRVTYNGSMSLNARESYGRLELMNAGERIQLSKDIIDQHLTYKRFPTLGYENLYFKYVNNEISGEQFEREVQKMSDRNTDWFDLLFRDALSTNHTVSLSGGSEQTRYYASLGYTNTPGTAKRSDSERYTLMMKLNSYLNEKLYAAVQINASMTENKGFYTGVNPSQWAYKTSRTLPAFNEDGSDYYIPTTSTAYREDGYYNINYLNELRNTGQQGRISSMTANLNLQWHIWDFLKYDVTGTIVNQRSTSQSWATDRSNVVARTRGYNYDSPSVTPGSAQYLASPLPQGGIFSNGETEQTSFTLRNQVDYSNTFGGMHTVSAMLTSEIRSVVAKGYSSTAYGWLHDRGQVFDPVVNSTNLNGYLSRIGNPSITDNTKNYVSWLGFASYIYNNKYFVNFNIRMDGSNQFGDNPKYRFLPVWSLSARYNLMGEEGIRRSLPFVSELSLRASYGIQGNVDKGTSPKLVARVGSIDSRTYLAKSTIQYYPNPDLRWEKTTSYNLGLDFNLWKGRLSGTFETYKKKGTDVIMNKQISGVNGVGYLKINGADMNNTGIEVDIVGYPVKNKNFEFGIGIKYGYNKNKLVKANDGKEITLADRLSGDALVEGETVGTIYSYHFAGLHPDNGYPIFYDKYGNTTFSKEVEENGANVTKTFPNFSIYEEEAGLVKSGIIDPPSSGGIQFHFRYKNWRMKTNFTYKFGGVSRLPDIYNKEYSSIFDPTLNVSTELNNRWRKPGDEKHTNIPALYDHQTYSQLEERPLDANLTERSGIYIYDQSSVRVAKTDNIRLNNISLSYMLPEQWLKKMRVSNMSFTLQATNLFLIADKAWLGFDPEMGKSANVSLPRTYTFNMNINF